MNPTPHPSFKGWTIPGPMVSPPEVNEENVTLDGLSGHYKIFQFKKGHRYSTDDLLVAWFGLSSAPRPDRILELGCGVGTISLLTAWKLPGAHITSVEAQDESVRLARKSIALNQLESRIKLIHSDFREAFSPETTERFDLIFGSPPYFPVGSGILGNHPQKVACRFELRGSVDDYCATAAKVIAPGGLFALIFPVNPPHQRGRMESAIEAHGWKCVRQRDVILSEGQAPLLGLYLLARKDHLPATYPTYTEEPLLIRKRTQGNDSQITDEYRFIKLSLGMPPTDH